MELRKANINNELDSWNEIINNSPDFYTIAHNPSLITFINNTLDWKGDSFFILNQKEIIGIYQHSYTNKNKSVSLPHFSYGGIIRKDEKYGCCRIIETLAFQWFFNDFGGFGVLWGIENHVKYENEKFWG